MTRKSFSRDQAFSVHHGTRFEKELWSPMQVQNRLRAGAPLLRRASSGEEECGFGGGILAGADGQVVAEVSAGGGGGGGRLLVEGYRVVEGEEVVGQIDSLDGLAGPIESFQGDDHSWHGWSDGSFGWLEQ